MLGGSAHTLVATLRRALLARHGEGGALAPVRFDEGMIGGQRRESRQCMRPTADDHNLGRLVLNNGVGVVDDGRRAGGCLPLVPRAPLSAAE